MNDSEVEELVRSFFEINISGNTMVPPPLGPVAPVNYTLLKMYADTIMPFNGDSSMLNSFQSACDFLFATYNQPNDPILGNYLLRVVRMKLIDRAQILVGSRMELNSWEHIKTALFACFGDKRNLECLEQDLFMAVPNKNENPLDFAKRLQVLRSALAQKINTFPDNHMDAATKIIYLRQYDQVTLRTFIRGLPGPLQSIIRLKNPDCIETAMTQVNEEDNFNYMQNVYNKTPTLQTKPTNNKTQNQTPYYHQNYPNKMYYNTFQAINKTPNFNTQFRPNMQFQVPNQTNNFQSSQFPRGPINIQPRYIPGNYPTNKQVFGTPKNVFKPTGQVPTNKPEPMSTRSRYTLPNQNIQGNQFFKPTGPRNFVSQELYQIDQNHTEQSVETTDTNTDASGTIATSIEGYPEEYQAVNLPDQYQYQYSNPFDGDFSQYYNMPDAYYPNSCENTQPFYEEPENTENFQTARPTNPGT